MANSQQKTTTVFDQHVILSNTIGYERRMVRAQFKRRYSKIFFLSTLFIYVKF